MAKILEYETNDRLMISYFTLLQFNFSALCVRHYWSEEHFNFKQKTV